MAFLYGDLTPAPFDSDPLRFLRGLLRYAAEVLGAADRIDTAETAVIARTRLAERRFADIQSLGRRLIDSLRVDGKETRGELAALADRIREAANDEVVSEVRRVRTELDSYREAAEGRIADERAASQRALEALLLGYDLPNASGQIAVSLGSDGRYAARLRILTEVGLSATISLAAEEEEAWRAPVRLVQLVRSLRVKVPRRGWLRRKPHLRRRNLAGYYLVGLVHSADGTSMQLRRTPVRDDEGVDLCFDPSTASIEVRPVVPPGMPSLPCHTATGDDAERLARFEEEMLEVALPLAEHRVRLIEAHLDRKPMDDATPMSLLERLVDAVGPKVQEIVRRSPTPGELRIYEVQPGGHRDRRTVGKEELARLLAGVPSSLEQALAPLGLKATRPAQPPAIPRQPPAVPAKAAAVPAKAATAPATSGAAPGLAPKGNRPLPPPPPRSRIRSSTEIDRGWEAPALPPLRRAATEA